jgi:hypothetical protein
MGSQRDTVVALQGLRRHGLLTKMTMVTTVTRRNDDVNYDWPDLISMKGVRQRLTVARIAKVCNDAITLNLACGGGSTGAIVLARAACTAINDLTTLARVVGLVTPKCIASCPPPLRPDRWLPCLLTCS